MKKIGILTLSASDNCGSLLQAYALQELLRVKIDAKINIIDFESPQSKRLYSLLPKWIFRYPGQVFRHIVYFLKLKKQKHDYNFFRKKYLALTQKKYSNSDELLSLNDAFDLIIVGSDQVWNVNMSDYDESFMLNWVSTPKIVAFAASLGGSKLTDKYSTEQVSSFLKRYNLLSVREVKAKQHISSITNIDSEIVLDPTLIVDTKIWFDLTKRRIVNDDYIFFYSWGYSNDTLNNVVKEYAKQKGLKVYVINANKWIRNHLSKYGFKLCRFGGPLAFLNLMRYAKMVFVESFHGIIFANIFNKDFFFLNNKSDNSLDPRIESVLTLFDKKNKSVRNISDIQVFEKQHITIQSKIIRDSFVNNKQSSLNFVDKIKKILH